MRQTVFVPSLTSFDEHFVHQIPEPLAVVGIEHHHWRESYFFVTHGPNVDSDVIIVALATYPARHMLDALVLGRVGGEPIIAFHTRPANGDPHSPSVGPVSVTVDEPYKSLHVVVASDGDFEAELDFEARTAHYPMRRGRMLDDDGSLLWDQSHMIQSGRFHGHYSKQGRIGHVDGWLGQRDHSWGVRDHGRIPMWMWLAIQLDDGMLGVWHWELANGERVFTDGCFAPADGSPPVPLVDFHHDLHWTDETGALVTYGPDGSAVVGLTGNVRFDLPGHRSVSVQGSGSWCAPYKPLYGGGQHIMSVETDDGRRGTAIYEITGNRHHRFFPEGLRST